VKVVRKAPRWASLVLVGCALYPRDPPAEVVLSRQWVAGSRVPEISVDTTDGSATILDLSEVLGLFAEAHVASAWEVEPLESESQQFKATLRLTRQAKTSSISAILIDRIAYPESVAVPFDANATLERMLRRIRLSQGCIEARPRNLSACLTPGTCVDGKALWCPPAATR